MALGVALAISNMMEDDQPRHHHHHQNHTDFKLFTRGYMVKSNSTSTLPSHTATANSGGVSPGLSARPAGRINVDMGNLSEESLRFLRMFQVQSVGGNAVTREMQPKVEAQQGRQVVVQGRKNGIISNNAISEEYPIAKPRQSPIARPRPVRINYMGRNLLDVGANMIGWSIYKPAELDDDYFQHRSQISRIMDAFPPAHEIRSCEQCDFHEYKYE